MGFENQKDIVVVFDSHKLCFGQELINQGKFQSKAVVNIKLKAARSHAEQRFGYCCQAK